MNKGGNFQVIESHTNRRITVTNVTLVLIAAETDIKNKLIIAELIRLSLEREKIRFLL